MLFRIPHQNLFSIFCQSYILLRDKNTNFDQFWLSEEKVLGTPDPNSFFLTPNYDTYTHLKSQQHFREYETKIMIFNTCFSLFTNKLYIKIIYEAQQQNLIIQFTFYKHVAQQQTKWKIFINMNLLYRTYEIDF